MNIKTNSPIIKNRKKITKRIAKFWNKISVSWDEIWGPHIHHGYYEKNESISPLDAQINLVKKLSSLIKINKGDKILDAGCGMGGSSIYLAQDFHVKVYGITLSKVQADIAAEKSEAAGLHDISFKIENALSMESFQDKSIDIVWSLESCEQFYDKNQFIKQVKRVLKTKGTLMLATWCSSNDEYEGKNAKLYQKLCRAFDLPYMPSLNYYEQILRENGIKLKKVLNITENVKKSWDIGITLVNAVSFVKILCKSGIRGIIFTKQLKIMQKAYKDKLINYIIFIGEKV